MPELKNLRCDYLERKIPTLSGNVKRRIELPLSIGRVSAGSLGYCHVFKKLAENRSYDSRIGRIHQVSICWHLLTP